MVINNGYNGNISRINGVNGINSLSNINKTGGINGVGGTGADTSVRRPTSGNQADFGSILNETINKSSGLKFSKHAELRLQARNISLTQSQKDKMNEAVSKAEAKGVKDSLVLMDNLAFVVNVKNRTVITAANSNELKDNVFTNIDGAVIV